MNLLADLEPGLSGLEQLQALLNSGKQPSIHETLDIALVHAEKGYVVVEARPGDRHLNPAGIVHGGYAAVIMDTACGCAAHSVLSPHSAFVTLELKVAYHRVITPQTGIVRAEGRVVSAGHHAAFTEAKLSDERGRLLATATSSLLIRASNSAKKNENQQTDASSAEQSENSDTVA